MMVSLFMIITAMMLMVAGAGAEMTPTVVPRWPTVQSAPPCSSNGDCNDGIVQTVDICLYGVCFNMGNESYCTRNADCEDWDHCSLNTCNLDMHACILDPVPDCCRSDFECALDPPRLIDFISPCIDFLCVENQCIITDPIEGCCIADVNCTDDACYTGTCNKGTFQCTIQEGNAGCECERREDCTHGPFSLIPDYFQWDRVVQCVAGVCTNVSAIPPENCTIDAECDDGDCCTLDACEHGICHSIPINNTDVCECCHYEDCGAYDTEWALPYPPECMIRHCINGRCQVEVLDDCCYIEEHCTLDDPPIGIASRCNQNTHLCEHYQQWDCVDHEDCSAEPHPCLQGACNLAVGVCYYEARANCCFTDAWCDDQEVCTEDRCHEPTHTCMNDPIYGCCHNNTECPPSTNCTVWECDHSVCHSHDLPNCCENHAECNDTNWCTWDYCLYPEHHCDRVPVPNCCHTVSDCNSYDVCIIDYCLSPSPEDLPDPLPGEPWKVCLHQEIPPPTCCHNASECFGTHEVCSYALCESNTCVYYPTEALPPLDCCAVTADCDDSHICTLDSCHPRRFECINDWIPDCCTNNEECNYDWCTIRQCNLTTNECFVVGPRCEPSDDPDCYTVQCNAQSQECYEVGRCVHWDPCVIGTCLNATHCQYEPRICEPDGNACTNDTCTTGFGCLYLSKICEPDGLLCTVDYCDNITGLCMYEPVECPEMPPCQTSICNPQTGFCVNGTVECPNVNQCLIGECNPLSGLCENVTRNCTTGNDLCASYECDLDQGCIVRYVGFLCHDGDQCTVDGCDSQIGCTYTPVQCASLACAVGYCDPLTGLCELNDTCPQDGLDACHIRYCNPYLNGGVCTVGERLCMPMDPCDDPYCDPILGCQSNSLDCDDHNPCIDNYCELPQGCFDVEHDCSDGDPCTVDLCNSTYTGMGDPCYHEPLDCSYLDDTCWWGVCNDSLVGEWGEDACYKEPVNCSDGLACTENLCANWGGGCYHPPLKCPKTPCYITECSEPYGCIAHPIECTGGDYCHPYLCNPETGECEVVPVECEQNEDLCTEHVCVEMIGCVEQLRDCSDGLRCTADSCHPDHGCINTPIQNCQRHSYWWTLVFAPVFIVSILMCFFACVYVPTIVERRRRRRQYKEIPTSSQTMKING
jgi:hypothetical protein